MGYVTNYDTQNMEQPLIMIIKAVCVFQLAHFAFNHYDYNLDNMCVSMSALFSVIMTKPNIFSNFAPGVLIRRGVSASFGQIYSAPERWGAQGALLGVFIKVGCQPSF